MHSLEVRNFVRLLFIARLPLLARIIVVLRGLLLSPSPPSLRFCFLSSLATTPNTSTLHPPSSTRRKCSLQTHTAPSDAAIHLDSGLTALRPITSCSAPELVPCGPFFFWSLPHRLVGSPNCLVLVHNHPPCDLPPRRALDCASSVCFSCSLRCWFSLFADLRLFPTVVTCVWLCA
ncbi:hypothetical protein BJX63DRAFT_304186 [Aspergillus granulosus]|uniref:Uncharacterized protein n=1 Tax=Aspergillus granulosus TaxID=176169 RepID=A0ABR4H5N4_9EURO